MQRTITIGGVEYVADFGMQENARVSIMNGIVAVSPDLSARSPGAEFEAIFRGMQSIEVLTGPPDENVEFGPLEVADGELLAIAKAKKKEEIKKAWEREIAVVGMPVPGENFSVNFDVADALIWENGLAMTADDPVMVRGIDNVMHPLSRDKALTVPGLQKQYYAAMIKKKWTLQSVADSAQTVEAVEAITWQRGEN